MLFFPFLSTKFPRAAAKSFLEDLAKIFLVTESCQFTYKMDSGIILFQKLHRCCQPNAVQYRTKRVSCFLFYHPGKICCRKMIFFRQRIQRSEERRVGKECRLRRER